MELGDVKKNDHEISQKYESLKLKFAVVVKEKEIIE